MLNNFSIMLCTLNKAALSNQFSVVSIRLSFCQGSTDFSVKGQIVNILSFVCHSQFCHCSYNAAVDNIQMNVAVSQHSFIYGHQNLNFA
jgi:hypothetical protein